MFRKILIANRGEIAVRIIRACQELGIKTVAIYSEEDKDSLHVKLADEAFCIGGAKIKDSYLNLANIISAAELLGADAIHPGYGFLSEDVNFANLCAECNIKFIGPKKEALEKMRNKVEAKKIAKKIGIPVLTGTFDEKINEFELIKQARKIGFPLIIKQLDGGGGSGISAVNSISELKLTYRKIKEDLRQITGTSKEIYIERYLPNPRHIEVQILADNEGNVVYLSQRDCSLQRRNQKLIEEAPAYSLNEDFRHALGRAAVKLAKAINYDNVGTVEFLVDEEKKQFYFIEMNTRLQVEHTVTEEIIGIDLVKEQIRIAAGEKLRISQIQTKPRGHAIECRINAEDAENDFAPSPGIIEKLILPGGIGIRIDTHIYQGYRISPYYDSLIAKLIAHGRDREEAIVRLKRALNEFKIEGIKTTIPFYQRILEDNDYLAGNVHINFIGEFIKRNYSNEGKNKETN